MPARTWTLLAALLLAACNDSASAVTEPDARVADARGPDAMAVPNLDRSACVPDESAPVDTARCGTGAPGVPSCNSWVPVPIPGAVCSDGSQYKIFVNLTKLSDDLEIHFEGGGACWDYPSCSGNGGIRGAANPHGIPDDHMSTYQFVNLLRRTNDNPVKDWNMVFIPYCTGDVHTGNKVATYVNPADGTSITFHHAGHDDVLKSVAWIAEHFPHVPRLLVTGCSAGGIGALQNYYFIREGLPGVQCGYLLDDSGPAFHSDGPSGQLHATIRAAWNLDPIIDGLRGKVDFDVDSLKQDFGLINVLLADRYPHDRLSLTLYRMDLNYSLYSYQRFFPGSTEDDIHRMWNQDLLEMAATYATRSNMAYFFPNFRTDNCSHCVSIPPVGHDFSTVISMPWLGSAIEQDGLDLKQFIVDLLDVQKPLASYLEDRLPNEVFPADESTMCMQGG